MRSRWLFGLLFLGFLGLAPAFLLLLLLLEFLLKLLYLFLGGLAEVHTQCGAFAPATWSHFPAQQ